MAFTFAFCCLFINVAVNGQIKKGDAVDNPNKEYYKQCEKYPSMTITAAIPRPYTGTYLASLSKDNESVYITYLERPVGPSFQSRIISKPVMTPNQMNLDFSQIQGSKPESGIYRITEDFTFFNMIDRFRFVVNIKNERFYGWFTNIGQKIPMERLNESLLMWKLNPKAVFQIRTKEDVEYFGAIYSDEGKHYCAYFDETHDKETKRRTLITTGDENFEIRDIHDAGLYDLYPKEGPRFGIMTFGSYHSNFNLTMRGDQPTIILGPFQDNQVLMGCPQTFCFSASVDGISDDPNPENRTKFYLFQQRYYWHMDFESDFYGGGYPKRLSRLKTQDDVNPYFLPPIDAAATAKSTLYVFKGDRIYYRFYHKQMTTFLWKPSSGMYNFNNSADRWAGDIDAAFGVPDAPDDLIIVVSDMYYWFKVNEKKMNDRSTGMDFQNKSSIAKFQGYPEQVESIHYDNSTRQLYAFSANWVYRHDLSQDACKGSFPPKCRATEMLFQELFQACNSYNYSGTIYKEREYMKSKTLSKSVIREARETDRSWILLVLAGLIVVLIIFGLLGTVVYVRMKTKEKQKVVETNVDTLPEPNILGPKKSGFSVTESLKEIVDERNRSRSVKSGKRPSQLAAVARSRSKTKQSPK